MSYLFASLIAIALIAGLSSNKSKRKYKERLTKQLQKTESSSSIKEIQTKVVKNTSSQETSDFKTPTPEAKNKSIKQGKPLNEETIRELTRRRVAKLFEESDASEEKKIKHAKENNKGTVNIYNREPLSKRPNHTDPTNTRETNVNSTNDVARALLNSGITTLYHFTDVNNLESIESMGGLYSKYDLDKAGVSSEHFGGNKLSWDLDKNRELDKYIHLSFCRDHPMIKRLEDEKRTVVLLKIDPKIVTPETKFSDINAADKNATIGTGLEGFNLVDIEATQQRYVRKLDDAFKPHQAEVLIKHFIPLEAIKNFEQVKRENQFQTYR